MLLMGGLVEDFNFAAHSGDIKASFDADVPANAGTHEPRELQPARSQFEQMADGEGNDSAERTLLTTGLTPRIESLFRQQARTDAASGRPCINP
jgi:hypothetical protein